MGKKPITIRFVYDGYYASGGEDVRWVSRQDKEMYSFIWKTSVGDDDTMDGSYSWLVNKICSKVRVDERTTELRISYMPFSISSTERRLPNYIREDEDVVCYLSDVNKQGFRAVLHVEVENNIEGNMRIDENWMSDQVSSENWINEIVADSEESNEENGRGGGIVTLYVGEPSQGNHEVVLNDETDENVDNYATIDDIREVKIQRVRVPWEDGLDIKKDQQFESKEALRMLIVKAGHKNCFEYDLIQSDKLRYVVKCSQAKEGCTWYIRAARGKLSQCFSIRTYRKIHTCSRTTTVTPRNRRKGTPRLVASVLAEDYPGKLDTPRPKPLIGLVQGRLGVHVSYSTAWRGRKLAASEVRGTPEEGFEHIYGYMFMLESLNPGTIYYVKKDAKNQFEYLFFALGASIEGFKYMRKVIVVDTTHIKTVYRGVLVVATAQDPNHHHYPIAFGVIDGENDLGWGWFFNK